MGIILILNPMAEITDDQYENIFKPMMAKMAEMKARDGITAEDDATVAAWREANPEEAKQEFMATWGAADTDGDGLINRTEYNSLMDMMTANGKNRHGKGLEFSTEDKDYMFDLMNKINPETDGFGMADLGGFGPAREKWVAEGNW